MQVSPTFQLDKASNCPRVPDNQGPNIAKGSAWWWVCGNLINCRFVWEYAPLNYNKGQVLHFFLILSLCILKGPCVTIKLEAAEPYLLFSGIGPALTTPDPTFPICWTHSALQMSMSWLMSMSPTPDKIKLMSLVCFSLLTFDWQSITTSVYTKQTPEITFLVYLWPSRRPIITLNYPMDSKLCAWTSNNEWSSKLHVM